MSSGVSPESKIVRAFLAAMCVVIGAGALLNLSILALQIISIAREYSGSGAWTLDIVRYISILSAGTLLDVVVFAMFIVFSLDIVRNRRFFARRQSARLGIIGACFLAQVFLRLAWPMRSSDSLGGSGIVIEPVAPHIDLRLLSFSFMFFALVGIFEYGRILQEDSDSIL